VAGGYRGRFVYSSVINTSFISLTNKDQVSRLTNRKRNLEMTAAADQLVVILSAYRKLEHLLPNDTSKNFLAYINADFAEVFPVLLTTTHRDWRIRHRG